MPTKVVCNLKLFVLENSISKLSASKSITLQFKKKNDPLICMFKKKQDVYLRIKAMNKDKSWDITGALAVHVTA